MADNTAGQTITTSVDQTGAQFAEGKIVFDATAITTTDYVRVQCGFKPRYICWENISDLSKFEWYEGFGANDTLKTVAAGTRTLAATAAAVVVDQQGFRILQNATLAAVFASKTCYWVAKG